MITFYVISLCAEVMRRIAGVSASHTSRVAAWMNMNVALPAPTKVSLEVGSIMLYATSGKEPKVTLGCALSVFRFGKQGCRLTSFPIPFEIFEAVTKINMVPLRRIADGEEEEEWYGCNSFSGCIHSLPEKPDRDGLQGMEQTAVIFFWVEWSVATGIHKSMVLQSYLTDLLNGFWNGSGHTGKARPSTTTSTT